MLPYKFPLTSGNVTRFFVVFILVLLLATGFMIHNAVNAWLTEKRFAMEDISHAMQKRIDTYRLAAWQIYENLAADAAGNTAPSNLQEMPLQPDIYYVEKTRRKTEALIFGPHERTALDMTSRMSSYLDTLWGAENSTWSMYFLNGQDNSLILISTLPLKDMTARDKDNAISNIVEARRAEMLQMANALDERESFSPLRRFTWQNDRYFTVRTTFNQPGHLATVVAFDLPVNDIIQRNMPLDNFQLKQDATPPPTESDDQGSSTYVTWMNPDIAVTATLPGTPLQLIYRVPITGLVVDTLHNLLWPLLANLGLLLLSLAGLILLRQQSLRPSENLSVELEAARLLNEEIVGRLPLGLLVYDFVNNRTIISNKIADHLLPHLNLQKIINMSDQHQGVLQATVNNEVYEIRHARSELSPHTQLFMMRDQDRELLVNKKLHKAQQVLDKNHQARQQLLQNLGQALQRPLHGVIASLQRLGNEHDLEQVNASLEASQALSRLVDDIVLLNQLETLDWAPDACPFKLQSLLDELVGEILPMMRRKGLSLTIANHLNSDEVRFSDRRALAKILSTLLHYAVTTTTWGRISLTVTSPKDSKDRLSIEIVDTGAGLSADEMANTEFPFLGETHQDRYGQASGMAFFLCKQLCKQLGGHLDISALQDIGTRYSIELHAPPEPQPGHEEKLLEGVNALIDITVEDVRKIVVRQLENWGASCITPDERFSGQQHDVLITDEPEHLTSWSLLVTDDDPGFTPIAGNQYRVNFNISSAMQDALLMLIEQQLAQDELADDGAEQQDTAQLFASGYLQLFIETVPDDIKRLYNETANRDYSTLAQTAHRLKGVFAMLNLSPGKQLCETLERHIQHRDEANIKNTTSEVDTYVKDLLQQGNQ
ncbi:phosphotransferase RcsD [Erwinia piriflorinigrans]|uniref:Phosphotransferase RcsD n=1 Tax=Erwinia piriflorinigrans CFBP 5888 TaxID=1161919 RepID=V5ZA11_9GAMM|nr:phosphotransferase RcsD [Erwinia piriflorinigrans]CCG87793.1 putative two-component system sensor kinase [Erwinia piriflorinigrans CFBP 5888]